MTVEQLGEVDQTAVDSDAPLAEEDASSQMVKGLMLCLRAWTALLRSDFSSILR